MLKSVNRINIAALILIIVLLCFQTIGCGPVGSGTPPEGTTNTGDTVTATPGYLSLSLSQTTVKSDDSDFAEVTATVLDGSRAVIPGITIMFNVNAGQLSNSSVVTNADGKAQTSFSSGTIDPSNRTATITATVSGLSPVMIPVQITGSTLSASTDTTTITDDGTTTTATLTITAANSGDIGLYNVPIQVSVSSVSGGGSASLSAIGTSTLTNGTGYTDENGELKIKVTGSSTGVVRVLAEGLQTSISKDYTVSPVSSTLRITSPATDPFSLATNINLTITATAPGQNNIRFVTSLGVLTGSLETGQVVVEPVSGGTASVVLNSSLAGLVTIQIFDADAAEPSPADTLKVAISAPSSEASQVALQVSPSVVPPSSGGISYSSKLIVTVKNASDQVVSGAPIHFSIIDPTGGGEYIDPVYVFTNDQGTATSTFTSGSLGSDSNGVSIKATVLVAPGYPEATQIITIGGTAASVVVGQGTTIRSTYDDTMYELPMVVQVTDANGNSVSGASVSLNAWPGKYAVGNWVEIENNKCEPIGPYIQDILDIDGDGDTEEYYSARTEWSNEDSNRNLSLDALEDANLDGQLTPPSTSVGSLPATVVTDESGVAQFDLQYEKSFAGWIRAEITATTIVSGTETRSTTRFWLGWLVDDSCFLPDSPFDSP